MKRVLVTGATGFLGSHVVFDLRDRDVVATGRNPDKLRRLAEHRLRVLPLDLAHPVANADMDRIGPLDAVIHCAGLSSPWGSDRAFAAANVAGTQNALRLAKHLGARRFVHISTASVYFQFCDQDGLREDALPPRFVNAYARTKRQAEELVLAQTTLAPIVLRPRGIYGAGDTTLLPRLLRVAARRPIPRFRADGATDLTHVSDVVRACIAAVDAPLAVSRQVLNVSGGEGVSMSEVIATACAATNCVPRWINLPFGPTLAAVRGVEAVAKRLPGRPEPPVTAYALGILRYRQTMDISAANGVLGWAPQVGFGEGVSMTFANGALRPGVV